MFTQASAVRTSTSVTHKDKGKEKNPALTKFQILCSMAHRIKLRCDDFDVIGAVPRDLSVIKNFLKRDCAVKRLIDIEENFLKRCMEQNAGESTEAKMKEKQKQLQEMGAIQPEQPPPDPCSSGTPTDANGPNYCDPCRRKKTSVVIEEVRSKQHGIIPSHLICIDSRFAANKTRYYQSGL